MRNHREARTPQYAVSMPTLKQEAFELCPRETRRSLLQKENKN